MKKIFLGENYFIIIKNYYNNDENNEVNNEVLEVVFHH